MTTTTKDNHKITAQTQWVDVKFILLDFVYPALNSQLHQVHHYCLKHSLDEAELLVSIITNEFEILVKQEQIELFPLLDELLHTHSKASNCKPFKEVKKHFTSIQQNIGMLLITAADNSDETLLKSIREIENTLNEIQKQKDKYFFVHFKNCTGCN
jgi:hypothetical protein